MRRRLLPALLTFVALSIAGCGGRGNVGEGCERPGMEEDCTDGAICAGDESEEGDPSDPVWESYTCRAICTSQDQCAVGDECRGVTGAAFTRACQPLRSSSL